LFIHGNTQTLLIDDSYMLVNNRKGAPCYVYKATFAIYVFVTVTCKLKKYTENALLRFHPHESCTKHHSVTQ